MSRWLKIVLASTLALEAACAPMPHTKVVGLDGLKTAVHETKDVLLVCAEKVGIPIWFLPLVAAPACAWIDFEKWTCDIYIFPGDAVNLEHEMLHCQGYDHFGVIQRGFDRWKEQKRANSH